MSYRSQHDPRISIAVVLGDEAHAFFSSNIGEYVLQCCDEEMHDAKEALAECDPEDSRKVRDLQSKIKIARKAVLWLNDILTAAEAAENNLRLEDDNT
jgi:hypothetical protein